MNNSRLRSTGTALLAILLNLLFCLTALAQKESAAVFSIKYLSNDAVYINAGRNAGIQEGMNISVVDAQAAAQSEGARFRGEEHVAELKVISVADSSAVCEIISTSGELKVGQIAFLTPESVQERRETQATAEADNFPIVVSFTYGDPLDDEVRQSEEKSLMQESPVGRMRGRLGFDYGGTNEASGFRSKQLGMIINADMTFLGGTYWNFTGYWRGNLTSSSAGISTNSPTTLNDLINRTYHLSFTYDNPYSPMRIGVGRLFLPWAPSLSTIDGAYFARKISRAMTVGVFRRVNAGPDFVELQPGPTNRRRFCELRKGRFQRGSVFLYGRHCGDDDSVASCATICVSREHVFVEAVFLVFQFVTSG